VTESRGNLRASPKSTAIQAPKSTLWTAFAKIGKLLQNAQNRVSASPDRGFLKGRTRHFGFQNTPFYLETKNIFRDRGPRIRAMTRRSLGVGVATAGTGVAMANTGPTLGDRRANTGQTLGKHWANTGQLSCDGVATTRENQQNTGVQAA
jgi:hypothetical protein